MEAEPEGSILPRLYANVALFAFFDIKHHAIKVKFINAAQLISKYRHHDSVLSVHVAQQSFSITTEILRLHFYQFNQLKSTQSKLFQLNIILANIISINLILVWSSRKVVDQCYERVFCCGNSIVDFVNKT